MKRRAETDRGESLAPGDPPARDVVGSARTSEPPEERQSASDHARSELASPEDPEVGPPLPASAVVAGALAGLRDRLARPLRAASAEVRQDATREMMRIAWPVMASQVLLNVTGLIDRMMIGRLAESGSAAVPLAAVGYATQIFNFVQTTLFSVGLACVALMARAIGAGDAERARHALAGSLQVSLALTLVYSSALFVWSEEVLRALGAEDGVVSVAAPYLELTVIAAMMLAFTLVFESALRADRDTRTPMWIAVVVTATKIAGNAVLIFGLFGLPRLELWGAGLATVISQAIGLALFLLVLAARPRDGATAVRLRDLLERNPMTREVVRIAVPGVAERIVLNLGLLSYFAVLSRWYGTLAVATYTVGVSLLSFSWIPGTGFAQAVSTLVGQVLGAGDREGAMTLGRRAVALAFYTSIPLALLFAWLRDPLSALFTEDQTVIDALSPFMLTLAIGQPFLQIHFTLGGAHRGAGDTVTPLVSAMVGNWLIRLPIALAIAAWLEADVVWIWVTLILDHIARTIWLGLSFARGRWRDGRGLTR